MYVCMYVCMYTEMNSLFQYILKQLDEIAQKDDFNSVFFQRLQYFRAQIPRKLLGGE